MTRQQRQTLDALQLYYAHFHTPPSVRLLCDILNRKSTSGVFSQLKALCQDGFLVRTKRGQFIPTGKCPCCGHDWAKAA